MRYIIERGLTGILVDSLDTLDTSKVKYIDLEDKDSTFLFDLSLGTIASFKGTDIKVIIISLDFLEYFIGRPNVAFGVELYVAPLSMKPLLDKTGLDFEYFDITNVCDRKITNLAEFSQLKVLADTFSNFKIEENYFKYFNELGKTFDTDILGFPAEFTKTVENIEDYIEKIIMPIFPYINYIKCPDNKVIDVQACTVFDSLDEMLKFRQLKEV